MIGLCFNHLVYILILAHVEAHMSGKYAHGLLYYGGTVVWVIGFGVLAVKLQHKILALATSVIGGPVFSLGFWSLLAEIFPKMQEDGWNAWSHPCTFDHANPCTADDGSAGAGIDGEARDPTSVEVLVPTLFTWVCTSLLTRTDKLPAARHACCRRRQRHPACESPTPGISVLGQA